MTAQQGPPRWLVEVFKAEKIVAPRLKSVLEHPRLYDVVGAVTYLRNGVGQHTERATRHLLHRANLPAGSDITRLLTEIGRLQNQVRELSLQVKQNPSPTPNQLDKKHA